MPGSAEKLSTGERRSRMLPRTSTGLEHYATCENQTCRALLSCSTSRASISPCSLLAKRPENRKNNTTIIHGTNTCSHISRCQAWQIIRVYSLWDVLKHGVSLSLLEPKCVGYPRFKPPSCRISRGEYTLLHSEGIVCIILASPEVPTTDRF
ncbi:hypothetical protein OE88DRAFT_958712 [Heliocybe sulcata]|uniref:Uncharacterized protein n=1 Tax=Heliocybe sulcata TaxID=5364 RepID=A0A5C3NCP8_9AGAM|nr:hypothetical protein OE88DRAFT_958712 [Heliocybe sulcata]